MCVDVSPVSPLSNINHQHPQRTHTTNCHSTVATVTTGLSHYRRHRHQPPLRSLTRVHPLPPDGGQGPDTHPAPPRSSGTPPSAAAASPAVHAEPPPSSHLPTYIRHPRQPMTRHGLHCRHPHPPAHATDQKLPHLLCRPCPTRNPRLLSLLLPPTRSNHAHPPTPLHMHHR